MRSGCTNSPIGIIFFGLIFLVAGIAAVFIFSRVGELSCARIEPSDYNCVRSTKLFGFIPLEKELLPTIHQAYLSESCDSDGCSYRVDMSTEQGTFSLVDYYSSGGGVYERQLETVDQINVFVSDPDAEELEIETETSEIIFSLFPIMFVVVGVLITVFGTRQFLLNLDEIR